MKNQQSITKKQDKALLRLVFLGLFSAMAFVLYLIEFPVIPSLSYLKLDFGDVPALVGAVVFGPVFGIVVEFVKNFIEMLVRGMGSQMGFGNIMNFIVGCAFVVPFSIVFKKIKKGGENKNAKAIALAGIAAVVSILIVGMAGNYLIAPLFFRHFLGIDLSNAELWTAIWGATAINAIKGAMLWVVSIPLVTVLQKRLAKFLPSNQSGNFGK